MDIAVPSANIKDFTRALTCLTRFGEDIDVAVTNDKIKLSSVNSSRTAFGVFAFEPDFFGRFELFEPETLLHFCVNGKALLTPLRSKSAAKIETLEISMTTEEQDGGEEGEGTGECRLIVRLHCQKGVVKTSRLTYGSTASLYAKANKAACENRWTVPSRVLKDWIEHFHLRTGGPGGISGGTDEISFICRQASCKLKSYRSVDEVTTSEMLFSRPMATEMEVDIGDFDDYHVDGEGTGALVIVTFPLKEFKAILAQADASSLAMTAHFIEGGKPLIITFSSDEGYSADFVIATTDYDGDDLEGIKSEHPVAAREPSRASSVAPASDRNRSSSADPKGKRRAETPLSRREESVAVLAPPTNTQAPGEPFDEDAAFDDLELGDEDFAAIDRLSQLPNSSQIEQPPPRSDQSRIRSAKMPKWNLLDP